MTSVSAFGMYGVDGDDWINFLVHGNQFRARMDQLGFVLGNGTIKGTVGLRADTGWIANILSINNGHNSPLTSETKSFNPTASVGIGYTSDMIGIGVGYNFTYIDRFVQVHTPVVVLNALNNNLRLAIPIQVAVAKDLGTGDDNTKFTSVGFNALELRYLTGIDAFNQIRVYFNYRNSTLETSADKSVSESFGLQVRLYFARTEIGNVTVNPYIRVDYDQALKGSSRGSYLTVANNYMNYDYIDSKNKQSDIYDVSPFRVFVKPVLSLAASSDTVSLYFEPSLGYAVVSSKYKGADQVTTHALNWGAYAELYVRPVQDLEWYFEMDVNGNVNGSKKANLDLPPVLFETTTGITWYLPSLGGNQ
ncbi:cell surface protein [uncultured Brachyspira sp.]|uniref:cell surface protein n=1 Tax=uncultured Brachyspira sp. TaxID=221953 RepID=UPI00262BBE4D|nr:cell surface protein [uncultured Brachyspira sp.]